MRLDAAARKVNWYARSTTAQTWRWDPMGSGAVWWWRPIQRTLTRAAWASPASSLVYELFFSHVPQDAFTASDVVALYEALWRL